MAEPIRPSSASPKPVRAPGAWSRSGRPPRAGRDLRPHLLEGRSPQADDRHELPLRGGLDVRRDLLGRDAGAGGESGGECGEVGHLSAVDADVDHLGRREQRLAVGVGDRGAFGQAPGQCEVLPLAEFGMNDRRRRDHLPVVAGPSQLEGGVIGPGGGRGEGPRRGPADRRLLVLHPDGADLRRQCRVGKVLRRLLEERRGRLGVVGGLGRCLGVTVRPVVEEGLGGRLDVVLSTAGAGGQGRQGDEQAGEQGRSPSCPHDDRLSCGCCGTGQDRLRRARWRSGRPRGNRPGGRRLAPQR